MKAITRLYEYFKYKDIRPTPFEKELGLGNGYFSLQYRREADIGSSILEKIIEVCRDLDVEWLISGRGTMIKTSIDLVPEVKAVTKEVVKESVALIDCEKCKMKDELITMKDEVIKTLLKQTDTQAKLIDYLEQKHP